MQPTSQSPYYLPLDSNQATLGLVGGKGQALAQLTNLNVPVPPGFHLTTIAYRHFVEANNLQAKIEQIINQIKPASSNTIEQATAAIQALFMAATMPARIGEALQKAYAELDGGQTAVAVRSSATAEDLPDLSFAGQQDTYLNVQGIKALQQAVQNCWASLWTTRAISYREHMSIDHQSIAMGIVIQKMISADISGI